MIHRRPGPTVATISITQKVRIAGQRPLYISLHDDEQPAEIFLRLKGSDCSSELIGLYDVRLKTISECIGSRSRRKSIVYRTPEIKEPPPHG
jgi:hypothetical protein